MEHETLEAVHTHTHKYVYKNGKNEELRTEKMDVNMSVLIKGIAIIFMVIHHLFAFPAWYIKGIDYSSVKILGKTLTECTLYSFKICVNMFAFISGYAYFYNKTPNIKYGVKKIFKLLKRYWFILFLLFIPLSLLRNASQITGKVILLNLFALDKRIITFSWYVYFFIFIMLTLPYVTKLFNGKKIYEFVFPIVCFTSLTLIVNYFKGVIPKEYIWIINDISNILYCYPTVIIGYLIAKYDAFNNFFNKYMKPKYLWQALIIILLVLGCRSKYEKIININLDIIYVPIIIYALIIVFSNIKNQFIIRFIKILGENSLNIWFLHSIIFANAWVGDIFQKIAFLPKKPILVVIWVFAILLPISIFINWVFKKQEIVTEKIKNKYVKKKSV